MTFSHSARWPGVGCAPRTIRLSPELRPEGVCATGARTAWIAVGAGTTTRTTPGPPTATTTAPATATTTWAFRLVAPQLASDGSGPNRRASCPHGNMGRKGEAAALLFPPLDRGQTTARWRFFSPRPYPGEGLGERVFLASGFCHGVWLGARGMYISPYVHRAVVALWHALHRQMGGKRACARL